MLCGCGDDIFVSALLYGHVSDCEADSGVGVNFGGGGRSPGGFWHLAKKACVFRQNFGFGLFRVRHCQI